jgi:RHS repeat-associated protein
LFWNPLGQLDSMSSRDSLGSPIVRVAWGYDGRGRQVRQSVYGGPTTRYLWDGENRVFELDGNGARKVFWTFYPGTQTPHSATFTTPGYADTTVYYVTDANHNTVALIKAGPAGSLITYAQFRYGPFGDSLAATGGVGVARLRYKGAYYDGYTGLYRMGVRYYDPAVGRFISEDPAGLEAGINPYTFAANMPVEGYDPSGEVALLLPAIVCSPRKPCPEQIWKMHSSEHRWPPGP